MDIANMLVPEFVIIAAVMYAIGAVLKQIPKFPNWAIPLALLIGGAALGAAYGPFAFGGQPWVYYLMMGALAGWVAVGANQTVKQIGNSKSE